MENYLKYEFYELLRSDYDTFNFIEETSPDGIWYWDANYTEKIWINPRFWKTLGYGPSEILNKDTWQDIIHPEDLKRLKSKFFAPKGGDAFPEEQTFRYAHKNGHNFPMQSKCKLIRNEEGKIIRMLVFHYLIHAPKDCEGKYKILLNSINDSLYVIDKQWNYIIVNDTAIEHTGIPKDKMLHSNVKDLFPGVQETDLFGLFRRVMHDRNSGMTETEYTFANNTKKWYEVRVYPVEEGILCISKDITDRKEAEFALQKNKERLEMMLNSSTDVFVELTAEGEQKFISPVIERYTGYSPDELKGSFTQVIHPDDLERIKEHWKDVIAQPEIIHRDEYRHIHKTKGYIWMEATLKSFLDNPNIQSIICSVRDISERKYAEQALKESEEQYKALGNAATEMLELDSLDEIYDYITETLSKQYPNAINVFVTADEKQYKTKVASIKGINNPLMQKVLNISKNNFLGREFNFLTDNYKKYKTGKLKEFKNGLANFAGSEIPAIVANSIEKMLGIHKIYAIGINKGEKLYAVLHFFTRKQTELTNHPYIESFIKQAGIVIERKIMEDKLKESEKQLSDTLTIKDKFFSIIAHDLKHPFNILLGFSNMNLTNIRKKQYDKVEEANKIIKESAEQGYILLNNLLEWAQAEQGAIKFKPDYHNLKERIQNATAHLSNIAEEKQIAIINKFKPNITFYSDGDMFDTIIRNLVSNAIKYTENGGSVTIRAKQLKNKLKVKVEDTGVGIKPEDINKLFKMEENYTSHGTSGEKGTGLGLILCKEFIEKHGGQIGVDSEPGKGSTFWFTLANRA